MNFLTEYHILRAVVGTLGAKGSMRKIRGFGANLLSPVIRKTANKPLNSKLTTTVTLYVVTVIFTNNANKVLKPSENKLLFCWQKWISFLCPSRQCFTFLRWWREWTFWRKYQPKTRNLHCMQQLCYPTFSLTRN